MTISNTINFPLITVLLIGIAIIWIVLKDLKYHEIPTGAIVLIILSAIFSLKGSMLPVVFQHAALGALTFIIFWGGGELYYKLTGLDGLGAGDAKLFAAGAFLLGPAYIPDLVLFASLGGIIACMIVRLRTGKLPEGIPFGPFISYAIFICLFQEPVFLGAHS